MPAIQPAPVGVGDIIARFGEQYRSGHRLPVHHLKTLRALQHCRTSALGGHAESCDSCGHLRIRYNSCRNRHCPQCQGLKQARWIDKLQALLPAVSYFHIVFSLPSEMNRLCLVNQRCLYDLLFKAASESLLLLARDSKYLQAPTGMLAVLHTWGQNLSDHPHLHTLVPAGGWDEKRQSWKPSRKKFFLPVKVLSAVFRGKFLSLLKAAYNNKELKFEGELKAIEAKAHFGKLLDNLYRKNWVVYSKAPFKTPAHVINYLGRYTHRVAISNSRILRADTDSVSFRWKDYKDGARQKVMQLKGEEFIRRFLLHVLPRGYCKIRYYGLFASRNRSVLKRILQAFGKTIRGLRYAEMDWQDLLKRLIGLDVTSCPVCKKGKMLELSMAAANRPP